VQNVRLHPGDPFDPPGGGSGHAPNRLNLLLSYAGWDDEPWVDRLPRLLDPMGVRSHHAADAREASRVIQSTPIHIAVVDLALPLEATAPAEEAGPRVLDLLARLASPPPTLVIKRGRTSRDDHREMAAALRAGAFAVLDRPRQHRDVETLLEMLRRVLMRHYANRWPTPPAG
jgi:DNA-binding NtrC family response regulator